ncbi:MAG: phage head closure protein [Telluria sp.]
MSLSDELDQLVVIQSPVAGKDAAGGNVTTWSDFDEVWAGFRNLSGAERKATSHGGQAVEARTEITIRYHPDLTARMAILHDGVRYNIRHVNNYNNQNLKMILTCDTGTAVAG